MEQERKTPRERTDDLIRQLVPDWRPNPQQVLWTVRIGVALVALYVLIRFGYALQWTGFGQTEVKQGVQSSKTLWDWMDLLIIPVVLAIGGYFFNSSQNRATQAAAERRAQDEALQAYLDQMSDMMIPNNDQPTLSDEHPPDSLKTVARARTLTVLPRLGGDRRARVVQFLYESGLIYEDSLVLDLSKADLSGAYLIEASLNGTNLSSAFLNDANLLGADLTGANLSNALLSKAVLTGANLSDALLIEASVSWADLTSADLTSADLSGAWLTGADLSDAWLSRADLTGARLSDALLRGADLSGAALRDTRLGRADLSGAELSRADLSGATDWTEQQLEQAESLEGATMPNGQKYEDWIKSKDRK
jgi:uncharacterized protein YjbI with pentapeptide repeats